jgi:hypothetical protein
LDWLGLAGEGSHRRMNVHAAFGSFAAHASDVALFAQDWNERRADRAGEWTAPEAARLEVVAERP